MPNGHVADVEYLAIFIGEGLFIFICFTPRLTIFHLKKTTHDFQTLIRFALRPAREFSTVIMGFLWVI